MHGEEDEDEEKKTMMKDLQHLMFQQKSESTTMSNLTSASGTDVSVSNSSGPANSHIYPHHDPFLLHHPPTDAAPDDQPPLKKKRNLPGNPGLVFLLLDLKTTQI